MDAREFDIATLLGPLDEIESKNAPKRLYLIGDETLLTRGVRVSIVGSRRASELGIARAKRLSRILVDRSVVVVSGLAEGIDTAAHRAAIGHGGRTIAVLGTPLDQCTPVANRELQEEIARDHLLISQFAPGTPSARKNFPIRNRTMAVISDATVIVEAGETSGTLHQGWEALRLGRPLFIMESVFEAGHAWAEEMTHYGAERLSDETLPLLFALLPEESRLERSQTPL